MGTQLVNLVCCKCKSVFCVEEQEGVKAFRKGCPCCLERGAFSNLQVVSKPLLNNQKLDIGIFEKGGGIWDFAPLLPRVRLKNQISLGEKRTPFFSLPEFASQLGLANFTIKDETRNPTGSYKDRMSSVAVSKAKDLGYQTVAISSTGNHGLSVAAYATKGKLNCVVLTIKDVIPEIYLDILLSLGTKVVLAENSRERWDLLQSAMGYQNWFSVGNSCYPPIGSQYYGIEGYKTIAYEIASDLRWNIPDAVAVPVSLGDGITGIWKGFCELFAAGVIDKLPKMIAGETNGYYEKALGFTSQEYPVQKYTLAPTLNISQATSQTISVLRESGGVPIRVSNEEIMETLINLIQEGILCEPASAVAVAAIKKAIERGFLSDKDSVCAVITSSGFKTGFPRKGGELLSGKQFTSLYL